MALFEQLRNLKEASYERRMAKLQIYTQAKIKAIDYAVELHYKEIADKIVAKIEKLIEMKDEDTVKLRFFEFERPIIIENQHLYPQVKMEEFLKRLIVKLEMDERLKGFKLTPEPMPECDGGYIIVDW